MVFKKQLSWTKAQLLISVRAGAPAPALEWIAVTAGHYSDDKPQFSPDGTTLFFTSDRDGYLCIWSQRLDPVTRHPVGPATAFEHFHNAMGRDAVSFPFLQWDSDLTVARDKILISLPNPKNDLWLQQLN